MLRQKPQILYTLNELTGVSGSQAFTIGTFDFNLLVAKLEAATLSGTSPTLDVYVQTSDDGGVTFYDLIHFAQVTAAITNANALFAQVEKGIQGYIGTASTLTLAAAKVSGLPLLGNTMKVVYTYGGTIGTANATLTLTAIDQDLR